MLAVGENGDGRSAVCARPLTHRLTMFVHGACAHWQDRADIPIAIVEVGLYGPSASPVLSWNAWRVLLHQLDENFARRQEANELDDQIAAKKRLNVGDRLFNAGLYPGSETGGFAIEATVLQDFHRFDRLGHPVEASRPQAVEYVFLTAEACH